MNDSDFRSRLLADPKAAIEAETGLQVPDQITIEIVEETARKFVLVIPPSKKDLLDAFHDPSLGGDVQRNCLQNNTTNGWD